MRPYKRAAFAAQRSKAVVLLSLLLLGGCVASETSLSRAKAVAALAECGSTGAGSCYFNNAPLRLDSTPVLLPGRPYTFFATARSLSFVDASKRQWGAPKATLTDGASIPQIFVSIVGSPRTPAFANAAAVHDAYCGVGNETGVSYHAAPWQEVHRMFYDTLVVGGTEPGLAKLMFAAVWLGGPRWYPLDGREDTQIDRVPDNIQTAIMSETKAFIAQSGPDLPELVSYLDWKEKEMLWRSNTLGSKPRRAAPNATSP